MQLMASWKVWSIEMGKCWGLYLLAWIIFLGIIFACQKVVVVVDGELDDADEANYGISVESETSPSE